MEATALSVGKSVLDGAIGYAQSALAEEVALQLGVRRDQVFITNELEMMKAFLESAHDEGGDDKVVKVWVKQVRDVAYNVEDCLQEFAVRLNKQSWWRIHCRLLDRRRVAKQMKELRANVEDISQRNTRYSLIKGSGSKATTTDQSAITGATMSGIEESRQQRDKATADLLLLINKKDNNLRVVAVSGTGTSHLGDTSIVKRAYEDPRIHKKFECRAWIGGLMCPFNLTEFLQSIIEQFLINFLQEAGETEKITLEVQVLRKMGKMRGDHFVDQFMRYVDENSYLIVLNGIHNIEEWGQIKPCFRNNKKGSRIIVSAEQVGVACLCVGPEDAAPEYKLLFVDQKLYAFYEKVFGKTTTLDEQGPELLEQANLILNKCKGLPLAIVVIGGFLANQPKSALKWRKLNENISAELEMNPELEIIRTVLMKSCDGLPYYLKSCFLYLSIFPEDKKINLKRLLRRWIAEGYSSVVRNKAAEEIAESYLVELISRSMLLPIQKSSYSRKGIDSCQVHDIIREIGISKSMEENLVFRLEEGCSLLNNQRMAARHLTINGNWEGDESEFESMVDMSRVRSFTVFGKWKSFFISEKMSLLRVLDLEDARGLVDHHLKHIGKLLHLMYLSLRGCDDIRHLPDSLGNLGQLETLDIRDTRIVMLPKTIIKLQKLKSLRALIRLVGHLSVRAVCTMFCCYASHGNSCGVLVPRGMKKLKALQTLGLVNIRQRGNVSLQEIKGLSQLPKLEVTGIDKNNGQELCASIVALSCLESLLICSNREPGLCGSLDGAFMFPEKLQSLKLYGNLVKLPEWVQGLKNLVKLKLRSSMISEHDAAIKVLGSLPNLAFLHLLKNSFDGEEVRLNFPPEMFPSLIVLELDLSLVVLRAVKFEQGATPKLELLNFCCVYIFSDSLSGLASLSGLKEVVLQGSIAHRGLEHVRAAVAENPNGPVVKVV